MEYVDQVKEGYHNARKLGRVIKIHFTQDFYLRLKADRDIFQIVDQFDLLYEINPPFMGHPIQVHAEGEKPFWFDIVDEVTNDPIIPKEKK